MCEINGLNVGISLVHRIPPLMKARSKCCNRSAFFSVGTISNRRIIVKKSVLNYTFKAVVVTLANWQKYRYSDEYSGQFLLNGRGVRLIVAVRPFVLRIHWENYISISFHIQWDMIAVTVFLSILNQMEFHLVQKIERKTVTTIISHWMWKEMGI